jgi:hypothetical protein
VFDNTDIEIVNLISQWDTINKIEIHEITLHDDTQEFVDAIINAVATQ